MTTQTIQIPEHKTGVPQTRLLHTKNEVEVELRIRMDPQPESRPVHSSIGGISYDVFLPDYARSDGNQTGGYVDVSFWKVGVYLPNSSDKRDWFTDRGISCDDTFSIIHRFYPLNPKAWPRRMGVGGTIMKEVMKDCKASGSAAVCCNATTDEIRGLLRGISFGFEEVPLGSDFFIKALR
jgi:hypothetical protein